MNTAQTTTAYPLSWPSGRARTPAHQRKHPKWLEGRSFAVVRDALMRELRLLGAKYVVLSTNIELRQDGLPYSGRRQPEDPGVAVYFTDRKKRHLAFCCDKWSKIEDNIRSIQKTIEAIRGIERWGACEVVDAAFSGFVALPPADLIRPWHVVFGVQAHASTEEVEKAYRIHRMVSHPDRGGSTEAFHEVERAWQQFREERGMGGHD